MNIKFFVSLCLFLSGAFCLIFPRGYSIGFYPLCFVGMFFFHIQIKKPFLDEFKYIIFPIYFYAFINIIFSFNENFSLRGLDNYLPFVFFGFGLYAIYKYIPKEDYFWSGIAFGSIGSFGLASYQAFFLGLRANGYTNAIQFGNIALVFGIVCLIGALVRKQNWQFRAFMLLGFISGLFSSILSQTRGGWVALVFILLWIIIYATKRMAKTHRYVSVFFLAFIVSAPALIPGGIVQSRIAEASIELQAFIVDGKEDTSVGARLAMWRVAIKEMQHSLIFGNDNQGWIQLRDTAIADGRLNTYSANFTHLHNEFIDILYKRGVIGLFVYMSLFLIPMWFHFKPHINDENNNKRALAMAGIALPMMYLDFALTQTFLSHNSGRVVLCSLWMCIAGLMSLHNERYPHLTTS